jgi:hypothetical protein
LYLYRNELSSLKYLANNEYTTEKLKICLIDVSKYCSQATYDIDNNNRMNFDIEALEKSLKALDNELNTSKNDNNDVHSMLRLASLVVRHSARSLLKVSKTSSGGRLLTVELRTRLKELSIMLNDVHDDRSANLLNNYSLGTLVQRITEEMSKDALISNNGDGGLTTFTLINEIQNNFDEKHRHSGLVLSVLGILRNVR